MDIVQKRQNQHQADQGHTDAGQPEICLPGRLQRFGWHELSFMPNLARMLFSGQTRVNPL